MKVSPWKGGWLVMQIRALSGTEAGLDLKQRSVNSSLGERKSRTPASPKHAKYFRVRFMKDYRASVFMILDSHSRLHVGLTDKIPLMRHIISVFNSLDSQKLGTLNRAGWLNQFSFLVSGFFHFSFLQHCKEIVCQGGICLKMGSKE